MQKLFIVAEDATGNQVARVEFTGDWIDTDLLIRTIKGIVHPRAGAVSMKIDVTFPLEEQFAAVQAVDMTMSGRPQKIMSTRS